MKADIEAASVAKLGRHFNERLLSDVHDRVEAIVARERKGEEARSADPAQIKGLHLALIAAMFGRRSPTWRCWNGRNVPRSKIAPRST